jgi:hypothetical protein
VSSSNRVDLRWKQNTCPICGRTFQVTPTDDYFIPACGCYADADPGHFPCEECGLSHIYACANAPRQRGFWGVVSRVVMRAKPPPPDRRLLEVVDGDRVIARAKGKEAGDALIGEFFVAPDEGEDRY